MEVLPAIDLRGGKVVQLAQGDFDRQTTYSDDPAAVAAELAGKGAAWIHVVDLDAAKSGTPTNTDAIASIRASAPGVKIELGGGARTTETVEYMLANLADRVVIGSAAMTDWAWFEQLACRDDLAGQIALGLDARGQKISVAGWTEEVSAGPVEIASRVKGWPIGAIIYTDITRDGMLSGVSLAATQELIAATDVPIIASGGVSCLQDIRGCKRIGCAGAIVGTAYYEGKIDLAEAIAEARANG